MKDLQKLIAQCENDLLSIGIQPGKVAKWSINTRAKSRWGQCKQVGNSVFEINISQQLLQDNITDQAVKDTILHELLHTIDGCMGHKGKWKELAAKVNKELPQYKIKRTTGSVEKGIEPEYEPETETVNEPVKNNHQKQSIMFYIASIVTLICIVCSIILTVVCITDYNSIKAEPFGNTASLLLGKGYLTEYFIFSFVGFISSFIAVKESEKKILRNIATTLTIIFILQFFISISVFLD